MSTNTLQIEIPKGFKIKSFDKETGKVSFEELPKDIKERIKSFDDVLEHLGIEPDDFEERIEDMTADEAAYVKIKLIAKALNEGWKPDWTNSNQYKYYPWFNMGSPSAGGFSYCVFVYWDTGSRCVSRLCFKSSELAKYAGQQFEAIYKDFLTLKS